MNLIFATHVTAGAAWFGLLLLGGSLWFVVNLIFADERGATEHFVSFALKTTAILLVIYGTISIALAVGNIVAIPALIILLIICAMIANRIRMSETRALMWQLSVASRKGVPIISTARAFAQERTDEIGHRTMLMVKQLEQGATLFDAMTKARLPMSADVGLVARSGLAQLSLPEVAASSNREMEPGPIDSTSVLHRILYLIAVCGFGLVSWFFMLTKICPTYEAIMADFGIEVPRLTAMLLGFSSNNRATLAAVLVFIFFATLILLAIPALIYYIGWLKWEPPMLRKLTARYHGAVILRGLATALDRHELLPDALEKLAAAYPTQHVRARLGHVIRDVEDGAHWISAVQAQRLITEPATGVLMAAERVGNLSWAMREMAGSLMRNLTFRISAIVQVVTVALVLLISLPIGFFAIALFAPLPELIMQLL